MFHNVISERKVARPPAFDLDQRCYFSEDA